MNIKIELFGAARDFSKQNILELNIENNSSLKDIRAKMIEYIKKNFDFPNRSFPIIKLSKAREDSGLLGAALLALNSE